MEFLEKACRKKLLPYAACCKVFGSVAYDAVKRLLKELPGCCVASAAVCVRLLSLSVRKRISSGWQQTSGLCWRCSGAIVLWSKT